MIESPRFLQNYCVRCGALDVEQAREGCGNPTWHMQPAQEAQPGACGRCICDEDRDDPCNCCHVAPCQEEDD